MNAMRFGLATVLSVVSTALFAAPVAAQTTTTDELISGLNMDLLYVAIPIVIVTEVALFYAVWKFRNNDEPKPTRENRRLEITWTIATAVILVFVGVASYGVLASPDVTHTDDAEIAPNDDDVHVVADSFQWGWTFEYPEEDVTGPGATMVVPVDTDIYITVTTQDVIHSFHVPEMGLKQDANPGMENTIKTHTTEEGTYQGYCAEFCGLAHSQMYFTVEVVSQEEYEEFIEDRQSD